MYPQPPVLPIIDLFEWAFQLTFSAQQKTAFAQELLEGWNNDDPSEQILANALVHLRDLVLQLPAEQRNANRGIIEAQLRLAIETPQPDDCGRVLRSLSVVLAEAGSAATVTGLFTEEMRARMHEQIQRNLRGGPPEMPPVAVPRREVPAPQVDLPVPRPSYPPTDSRSGPMPIVPPENTDPGAARSKDAQIEAYRKASEANFVRTMGAFRTVILHNAWKRPW